MKENTYTAPAVVNCTDAVQNTKAIDGEPTDGEPVVGDRPPGTIGFYL